MVNSRVRRLVTNSTGTAVTGVEVLHSGRDAASSHTGTYTAGFFALCAGAVNSAGILLASVQKSGCGEVYDSPRSARPQIYTHHPLRVHPLARRLLRRVTSPRSAAPVPVNHVKRLIACRNESIGKPDRTRTTWVRRSSAIPARRSSGPSLPARLCSFPRLRADA
jgi:hypothetical protein